MSHCETDQRSRVGPWEILGELGRGGMGFVWRVRHHQSGLMGALKARRAISGELGWREVDALARLDHGNIVAIYDQGLLPRDVTFGISEGAADEVAPAGAPYYVMALARESLAARLREGLLTFAETAAVLEGTLRALGHLHAHGVLHRDIKPDNVLLVGPKLVVPRRVWLADFGLAGRADRMGSHGGTPRFMAPEQVQRRGGAIGPWTDLYAVGLLGWVMVCGHLPNRQGPSGHAIMPIGLERLEPMIEVPRGFEAWLRWLLELAPERRPESAAEVLSALLSLGATAPVGGEAVEVHADDATVDATRDVSIAGGAGGAAQETPRANRPLSLPASAHDESSRAVGLGLVGRRVYPLVGRDAPMAALMAAAQRAFGADPGAARELVRVAVTGPDGIGKSRLIDGFVASLAELRPVRVARLGDSEDGVGLLTGLLGLPRVVPPDEDLLEARLFGAPSWVRAVVRVALERGAEAGAVEAAARWLLESARVPVLVIEDVGEQGGAEAGLVARLGQGSGCGLMVSTRSLEGASKVELEPLGRDDTLYLTREVLALEEGLAAAVVEVSQGHPATLVALLSALVERDALVASPHGWALADVAARPSVWLTAALEGKGVSEWARLEALGSDREDGERALVALALGGVRPDTALLSEVLGAPLHEVDGLLMRLGALGLVTLGERVGLARPALAAALVAASAERGSQLRAAWARALARLSERGSQAERARALTAWARQLEALGEPSAGVALSAARLHLLRGAAGEALAALEGGMGDDAAVARAEALIQLGRHAEGLALLAPLSERADARWLEGQVARLAGRHIEALSAYDAVLALESDPLARARTRVRRSMSLRELGRLDEAVNELEEAGVLAAGEPFDRVLWLRANAQVARALGRPDEQLVAAREAVALAEGLGSPGDHGAALTDFAGAANQLGRHAEALDALRRGQRVSRALGRADQAIDFLNLGLVGLSHGEVGDADRDLEEAILALGRLGWDAPLSAAHALRLVSLGRLGAWARWGEHLAEAERLLMVTGVRDPDVKRALWEAVALSEAAGLEPEVVGRVRALALAQG